MFDFGASELLVIVIVAIIVIGPKDLPLALRTAGRWMGKIRRISNHFRSGVETMIREAELEEMEKKWQAQNEKIMAQHPGEMTGANASGEDFPAAEPAASAEAAARPEAGGPSRSESGRGRRLQTGSRV